MAAKLETALATLVASAALFGAIYVLSGRLAERAGLYRPYDVGYFPSGGWVAAVAGGQRLLLSDLYWLATVQYIGEPRAKERGWAKLYPLVDLVTDLDPRHGYAYHSTGIVLSSVGLLDESDRILQKGMRHGPAWWSYPFYIAFNDFFYRKDYAAAAHWAEIAAKTPGASTRISQLALALNVKSGAPEHAVQFLGEMRQTARDEKTQEALDEQYRLAVLQRDFARLDAAVAAFERQEGRRPPSLEEVVRAGHLERIPKEPFGGRYYLGRDGKVHSSARDLRFETDRP